MAVHKLKSWRICTHQIVLAFQELGFRVCRLIRTHLLERPFAFISDDIFKVVFNFRLININFRKRQRQMIDFELGRQIKGCHSFIKEKIMNIGFRASMSYRQLVLTLLGRRIKSFYKKKSFPVLVFILIHLLRNDLLKSFQTAKRQFIISHCLHCLQSFVITHGL